MISRLFFRGYRNTSRRLASLIFLVGTLWLLAACAGPRSANHSFGFDIRNAVPAVEIIDYRYGQSNLPVRAPEQSVKRGTPLYFNGVSGPMRIGDDLYVKWRLRDSGETHEDTVDLRSRLPRDLENQRLYLDIEGPQLYVYIISREEMPPGATACPAKEVWQRMRKSTSSPERIFARFCYFKTITQIYPDPPKKL